MRRATTKNILLSAGAYYLSMWVAPLLSVTFDWFTDGIIYTRISKGQSSSTRFGFPGGTSRRGSRWCHGVVG